MADTTYTDGTTIITADSMNDLNRLHYTILGDPANVAAVVAAIDAVQADQETGTSVAVVVTPGVQKFHQSACKAWGLVANNGVSASLTVGFGISAVNRVSAGIVDVTFTTAFSSANYCPITSSADAGAITHVTSFAAGSIRVVTRLSTVSSALDAAFCIAVFGDV